MSVANSSIKFLIKKVLEKDYKNLLLFILKSMKLRLDKYNYDTEYAELFFKFEKYFLDKYNLLDRMIFVTSDLEGLIRDLNNELGDGIEVNQGPQKWRGQINYLNFIINKIDSDFRYSMCRHNEYHVSNRTIPENYLLGKSKFSFKNIHLNLGNVRYYSTKSHKPKLYKKPIMKGNHTIFVDINEFLRGSPKNENTQLEIENSLIDDSYISLNKKV